MELRMSKVLILLLAVAVVAPADIAQAEDKSIVNPAPSMSTMTKEQFEALSPNATIEFNGQIMKKQEFVARNVSAATALKRKIEDARKETKTRFEAKRKAFLDGEQAKLDYANKQVWAAARKLQAQATAGRSGDLDARIQQAIALLERGKTAPASDAAQIESQERELLKVLDPGASKKLAQ
jgi:hypothetical protein